MGFTVSADSQWNVHVRVQYVTAILIHETPQKTIVLQWGALSQRFIDKSIGERRRRLPVVSIVDQNGGHIEHIMIQCLWCRPNIIVVTYCALEYFWSIARWNSLQIGPIISLYQTCWYTWRPLACYRFALIFTARRACIARICCGKTSVCLSVCLSVTRRYCA